MSLPHPAGMLACRCKSENIACGRTLLEDANKEFCRAGSGEEVGDSHVVMAELSDRAEGRANYWRAKDDTRERSVGSAN